MVVQTLNLAKGGEKLLLTTVYANACICNNKSNGNVAGKEKHSEVNEWENFQLLCYNVINYGRTCTVFLDKH